MKIKKLIKKIYSGLFKARILMFHHLSDKPEIDKSGCKLNTEKFYACVLKEKNIVPIHELINDSMLGIQNKTAISFDDGLSDVYTIAYPFLKENNIPFTVFVLSEFIDTPGYISTAQLLELSGDPLVTIGAHGTKHRILTQLSEAEQRDEIVNSKKKLESILNTEVNIFAYSHGQYNEKIIELVKEAGYKYACSVISRHFGILDKFKNYELPRLNIDNTTIDKYL